VRVRQQKAAGVLRHLEEPHSTLRITCSRWVSVSAENHLTTAIIHYAQWISGLQTQAASNR